MAELLKKFLVSFKGHASGVVMAPGEHEAKRIYADEIGILDDNPYYPIGMVVEQVETEKK